MGSIDAETRLAAVQAQGQTSNEQQFVARYIEANYDPMSGKSRSQLGIEASQLYLTVARQLTGAYGVQSDEMQAVLDYVESPFNRNNQDVIVFQNPENHTADELEAATRNIVTRIAGISAALEAVK